MLVTWGEDGRKTETSGERSNSQQKSEERGGSMWIPKQVKLHVQGSETRMCLVSLKSSKKN